MQSDGSALVACRLDVADEQGNIESQDVHADFERFKAAGAIVIAEPYAFEGETASSIATFADPDDNYFQLMSPMTP